MRRLKRFDLSAPEGTEAERFPKTPPFPLRKSPARQQSPPTSRLCNKESRYLRPEQYILFATEWFEFQYAPR